VTSGGFGPTGDEGDHCSGAGRAEHADDRVHHEQANPEIGST